MIEASKLRQTAWHTLPGDEVVGELGTDPDAGLSGEEAEERLTLAVFYWMLRQDASLEEARSVAMTQMVMFQFFHVFNSRSLRRSAFRIPLTANPFLAISMVLAGLAHLGVLYLPLMQGVFGTVPLDPVHWGVVIAVGSSILVAVEIEKVFLRRRERVGAR